MATSGKGPFFYIKLEVKSLERSSCSLKFVKCYRDETIGGMLSKELPEDVGISRIVTNEADVEPDMPVNVLEEFGHKSMVVWIHKINLNDPDAIRDGNNNINPVRNITDVLMRASKTYKSFPAKKNEVTAKDQLYNNIIAMLTNSGIGFTSNQAETVGKHVVTTLADALWYLDPHREKIEKRSIVLIPKMFKPMMGCRNLKQQHKKTPELLSDEIQVYIDSLSSIIMLPWILRPQNIVLHDAVDLIVSGMKKYKIYMTECNRKTKENYSKTNPVRDINDNWYLKTIDMAAEINPPYQNINAVIMNIEPYQAVDLIDFEPQSKDERKVWIQKLALSYPVTFFTYRYGNYLGNLNIIWKIPKLIKDRNTQKEIQTVNNVKEDIMKFATRQMRKDFIDRYKKCPGMQPVILRSMFNFLTEFEHQSSTDREAEIDERLMRFLLESEDTNLIFDLRKNNGRPVMEKYVPFWDELVKYLDEKSAVHERRTTNMLYLPFAMSVEDLRNQILERLPEGAEAPSLSWIRLNFSPSNAYLNSAKNYTGRFKVKFAIQQRLVRVQHPDAHFCSVLFSYLKEFACKYRELAVFQCLDDKAVVPVGEPGHPVSTRVRAHHGGIVSESAQIVALDHDFHVAGIIPSVCFMIEIPRSPSDSFYNGTIHITVKDKVFQPSSPLRHATENMATIREHYSDDDVNLNKPILIRYTDGGPDHRTTYNSVKLATLIEFIAYDLDLVICVRTAPCGSYVNPAERCMSVLNLALQNIALERPSMGPQFEMQVKSAGSLKKLRNLADKNPRLKTAYEDSIGSTVGILKERFKKLKWKGENVLINGFVAFKEAMKAITDLLKLIDGDLDLENKELSKIKSRKIDDFLKSHSRSRHYSFQIKKCLQDNCSYCVLNPVRMPEEIFRELSFLPDPVSSPSGGFKAFTEVFGTDTNDSDRPGLKENPTASDRDKKFKALLVGTKVRGFVICHECGKRRVIYSPKRLTRDEEKALVRLQEELLYSCGNILFPGGEYQDTVIVREGMNCTSQIETQYYAGQTQVFDALCIYCGDPEVVGDDNDEISRLKNDNAIVRPICASCMNYGMKILTRNAKRK